MTGHVADSRGDGRFFFSQPSVKRYFLVSLCFLSLGAPVISR